MAYAIPEQWTHLEYPTAAKLNKYKDGLDATYTLLGTYQLNPAVAKRISNVQGYYFVHKHRWLLYYGDGTIEDPTGVGENVSLSDESGWAAYDLTQVSWLYAGKLYQVQGVDMALEDYENL